MDNGLTLFGFNVNGNGSNFEKRLARAYWAFRFSLLGRIYFTIKTFFYLQANAYKIAWALETSLRQLGQMDHTSNHKTQCKKCEAKIQIDCMADVMTMKVSTRHDLIKNGYSSLPNWKWWKDYQ